MILFRDHPPASAHTNCLIVLLNSSEPLRDSDLREPFVSQRGGALYRPLRALQLFFRFAYRSLQLLSLPGFPFSEARILQRAGLFARAFFQYFSTLTSSCFRFRASPSASRAFYSAPCFLQPLFFSIFQHLLQLQNPLSNSSSAVARIIGAGFSASTTFRNKDKII